MQLIRTCSILVCLLVAGCGFHLRGSIIVPEHFRQVQISMPDSHDPFYQAIHQQFRQYNIAVLESAAKVPALNIQSASFSQQEVATAATGQANRYRVSFAVQFNFVDANGKTLIETSYVTRSREFNAQPNEVLSGEQEYRLIQSELRQEVALQIMSRVSRVLRAAELTGASQE